MNVWERSMSSAYKHKLPRYNDSWYSWQFQVLLYTVTPAYITDQHADDWSRMTYSGKASWCEEPRWYGSTVTCGMLPTLRELASKGCNSRGSVCLVPIDGEMDAASHLQMTLLEAYCREIGIKVVSVPKETIQLHLCPGSTDLSCVLISKENSYFPKLPKLPKWNLKTCPWELKLKDRIICGLSQAEAICWGFCVGEEILRAKNEEEFWFGDVSCVSHQRDY